MRNKLKFIDVAYVTDVEYLGPNAGNIKYSILNGGGLGTASPMSSDLKSFPIGGEVVFLFKVPKQFNFPNSINNIFYLSGVNMWNSPSLNSIFNSAQINAPSSSFFNFDPYKVKDIQPLQSFPGDTILEGNFGNSIRLGNTYTTPSLGNGWSIEGNNGDPITILRNGQSTDYNQIFTLNQPQIEEKLFNITENLINDHSSIYLTSFQRFYNYKIANDSFSSYETNPTLPSNYNSPQIILNSDRIILNARKDHILISGEVSVGLSSNTSLNFDSTQIHMEGIDIKIGSSDPNLLQPALLGDDTVNLLINLTSQIKKLGEIALVAKTYDKGKEAPDGEVNLIGENIISQCDNIINKLNDNKRGIKSNFVKVR